MWVKSPRQFRGNDFHVWHWDGTLEDGNVGIAMGLDPEDCRGPQTATDAQVESLKEASTQIGAVLWHEAINALLTWLEGRRNTYSQMRVLELGAGTGVVGLALASDGAVVTITDLGPLMPLLQLNASDGAGLVEAAELRWGGTTDLHTEFDLIVGSDIIYDLANQVELLETLKQLMTLDSECCIALNLRDGGALLADFLGKLEMMDFTCQMQIEKSKANDEGAETNPIALLSIRKSDCTNKTTTDS